jgi:hypothetical protein
MELSVISYQLLETGNSQPITDNLLLIYRSGISPTFPRCKIGVKNAGARGEALGARKLKG